MTSTALRVAVFIGTRPEAIKVAPVVRLLSVDDRFELTLVSTGQHGSLLEEMLEALGLKVDAHLEIARSRQGLNELTSQIIEQTDRLLERLKPQIVVVQGDTTSAFGVGLAAFHRGVKVTHLEAGLRSYDRFHPFPEESNRRMIAAFADLHLAPTATAKAQLVREGIWEPEVLITGNTTVDVLLEELERQEEADGGLSEDPDVVLITLHRRETWASAVGPGGTVLQSMLGALAQAAGNHPELRFVFPVHPNPKVRQPVEQALGALPNVRLLDPQPFPLFVGWMRRSRVILTDSGGIQEEAPTLGVPVLVLRRTTERPEALEGGENRLVGTRPEELLSSLEDVLSEPAPNSFQRPYPSPFGDGHASERVRDALLFLVGRGPRPEEFVGSRALESNELPRAL